MKTTVTFLLIIAALLLSLPVFADRPADAGVERIEIEGYDNWSRNNPVLPGTITCPGGQLELAPNGMPVCSDTDRLHVRDVLLWSCITSPADPRISGAGQFTINGNFNADYSGPVWGKWTIVPLEDCDPDSAYPGVLMNPTVFWHGTWQGKRVFYLDAGVPIWLGDLKLVGKGSGGDIDGLHFKGTELITTFTPFPLPYELLPIPGLAGEPEGLVDGIIKQ